MFMTQMQRHTPTQIIFLEIITFMLGHHISSISAPHFFLSVHERFDVSLNMFILHGHTQNLFILHKNIKNIFKRRVYLRYFFQYFCVRKYATLVHPNRPKAIRPKTNLFFLFFEKKNLV